MESRTRRRYPTEFKREAVPMGAFRGVCSVGHNAQSACGIHRFAPGRLYAYVLLAAAWLSAGVPHSAHSNAGLPCTLELAAQGAEKQGVCRDILALANHEVLSGPDMVVIPGTDRIRSFALGKYEITFGEYALYCRATKRCRLPADARRGQPVTNISLGDTLQYALWISETASRYAGTAIVYRLPGITEWQHAATIAKPAPLRSINCHVKSTYNISGAPIAAHVGKANGWGLVNLVGNVREWVLSPSNDPAVAGGSFNDYLPDGKQGEQGVTSSNVPEPDSTRSVCSAKLVSRHFGVADPETGFRLLREISP